MRPYLFAISLGLLASGCADGGDEERAESEVRFSATHHMFGFRTLPGFGTFPVSADVVDSDRGVLNLFDDSNYTVTRTTGTSASDRYALERPGTFQVFITNAQRASSIVFLGGYSRVGSPDDTSPGSTPDYFFTDRISGANNFLGFYYGTRIVTGQVELEGGWHALSLHVVMGQTLPDADNVARAVHGGISISAGAPGTLRTISGSGNQGAAAMVFGGSIQNLLTNNSGNGSCNLTVDYAVTGQSNDSRVMRAAATDKLILGLDEDETDGEAGVAIFVRKFDTGAALESLRIPGTFLIGGQTVFVNPLNCGADVFVGTMTLTSGGAFTLDAVDNQGQDFAYSGSWAPRSVNDGSITMTVSGTNETWFAAIDRSYNTLVFVDDFLETRSNNLPEYNLGFGVRQKPE